MGKKFPKSRRRFIASGYKKPHFFIASGVVLASNIPVLIAGFCVAF